MSGSLPASKTSTAASPNDRANKRTNKLREGTRGDWNLVETFAFEGRKVPAR